MSAFRALRQSPAYTSVALLTLALGIGVNTAMFSLIDAVLFRSLPFPRADRLVQIRATTQQGERREFAEAEQREIRGQTDAFDFATGKVIIPTSGGSPDLTAQPQEAQIYSVFQPLLEGSEQKGLPWSIRYPDYREAYWKPLDGCKPTWRTAKPSTRAAVARL